MLASYNPCIPRVRSKFRLSSPVLAALPLSAAPPAGVFDLLSPYRILSALLVLVIVYMLIRFITAALEALSRRVARARFFFKALPPIIRFVFWLGGTLVIVSIFAPSKNTLWAGIASVGIALGLGAQDLVKNLIGGIVILIDRPYQLATV